ncbi:hypothetical protein NDN08_002353 [Rhodosorus marinus]|uniref:Protein transport protein SEC23 n=1 Tax=Rhodosorus marinus TaxID=101924 RepID=A0AAV8UW97_9RHOD|nr:hypothetical protein NDN08_002353 [Rhodosorus marinus]
MFRATTSRFPTTAEVKNESGVPWGALLTPLVSFTPDESGVFLQKASSGLSRHGSSGMQGAPKARNSPGPSLRTRPPVNKPTAEDIDRCNACGAYISRSTRMVAVFWRCSICGKRNDLGERYTSLVDGLDRASLQELSADFFEAEVERDLESNGSGYIYVIDTCGSEETVLHLRDAVMASIEMLGEDDLVGVMLLGSETIALLDPYQSNPSNAPLFRRIGVVKGGSCRVRLQAVIDPRRWLRPLRGEGRACIVAGLKHVNRSSTKRPRRNGGDANESPCLESGLKALFELWEGVSELTKAVRCFLLLGKRYLFKGLGISVLRASQQGEAGIMVDCAVLDDDARPPLPVAAVMKSFEPLVRSTGGSFILCENAKAIRDELCLSLEKTVALDGLMRIRTTTSFRISRWHGAGLAQDPQVDDMFHINLQSSSHSLAVMFEFSTSDGFLAADMQPCVQLALKYREVRAGWPTRRLLRVHTLQFTTDQSAERVRREADPEVVFSLLTRSVLEVARSVGPDAAAESMRTWLTVLMTKVSNSERKSKKNNTAQGTAFIDRVSRLVYGLCQRSNLSDPYILSRWENLPPEWLAAAVYPRMLGFTAGEDAEGIYGTQPRDLHLALSSMVDSALPLFIIDAYTKVVVYLYTPSASVHAQASFPPSEDSAPMQVVRRLRRSRPIRTQLLTLRHGVKEDEAVVKTFLIEDDEREAGAVVLNMSDQPQNDPVQEPASAYDRFRREISGVVN